jgi:hypothetical protein
VIGYRARDRGRTVDRSQDTYVIARGNAAIVTPDAEKRGGLRGGRRFMRVHSECVVALEIAHRQILRVDVLAAANQPAREADDLPVAAHRFALRDIAQGNLVPRRNHARDGVLAMQRRTRQQLLARNGDVVAPVEQNQRGRKRGSGGRIEGSHCGAPLKAPRTPT